MVYIKVLQSPDHGRPAERSSKERIHNELTSLKTSSEAHDGFPFGPRALEYTEMP